MRDTLFHRTISFFVLSVFLLGLALWGAPQLFGVTVYKLGLVFASASAGYWIDRVTFPYARPDKLFVNEPLFSVTADGYEQVTDNHAAYAMLRRAIIMAACMICVGLGA